MSLNIERLASTMQRELSRILMLESHEDMLKMVTITEVRITNDLSFATIYYSCFNNEGRKEKIQEALTRAKGFLKSEIAKRVEMRKMPDFIFKYDEALEYGNSIEKKLFEIKNEKK